VLKNHLLQTFITQKVLNEKMIYYSVWKALEISYKNMQ